MASATVPQKSPRRDPRPRPVEAGSGKTRLLNKDPSKFYVLVSNTGHDQIGEYESLGYERVTADPGGPRLAVVKTRDGEVVTYQDSVLMSISKERKAEIDMFGDDGDGGWNQATKMEERILDRRSAQADLMRGIGGARGYVGVQSQIEPMRPDMGPVGPYTES